MHTRILRIPFLFLAVGFLVSISEISSAQSIERIQFSGLSSGSNSFQAVAGVPFGKHLSAGNGASLTVSSEYGKSGFVPLQVEPSGHSGTMEWEVFPNPVVHELHVRHRGGNSNPQNMVLLDALGREICRQALQGEDSRLFMGDLPAGSYRLQFGGRSWQILKH